MIQCQQDRYGWELLFLRADIDAVGTTGHLDIAPLDAHWKDAIEEDFHRRQKKERR